MANKKTKKKQTVPQTESLAKREYNEEEKASIAKYQELAKRKPVKFKEVKGEPGKLSVDFEYPDGQLRRVKLSEAFGTANPDLQGYLLEQVAQTFKGTVSSDGQDNKAVVAAFNKALAILNGIQPQDEIEGMLAVQLIGVHNLAVDALFRAMLNGQTFEGRKANVSHAAQMSRAFIMQMEALKKYRTSSQIRMIVGSVSVSDGGQAIVGTVNQNAEKKTQGNNI